ncbi:hypothetical protein MP228_009851 [Amoeboaphelidium protococcarum]|nr:hypothetical protein MP228_009851 [Amoeboaphelidium protococcarum]
MSGAVQKKKMEGNPDANLTSIGNYSFIKTLGEGNFAKVKLAKHKITGQEVAIKIIDKMQMDEQKLSKLYREVRILKLLNHPNVVKMYEVVETRYTIFLVMEYVSGGELYDYLVVHGRMKERDARPKFRQILSAVSYCHKKRVIHRDLKAENLLLDADMNIKIADFGFSNIFDPDSKLDTFCGSPPYAAPELFVGKRYIGPEVDVWSIGVILYVLTTGCLPFEGKNLQEMRESVCRGKYRIPFYISESCEKLLRKFLVRDASKRPSLDILYDDEWINEGFDHSPIVLDVNEEKVVQDNLILNIMESKFGIEREIIIDGLANDVHDENMAIYYLLYEEKRRNGEASVIRIGDTMAIKSPFAAFLNQSTHQHHVASQPHGISMIKEEGSNSSDLAPKLTESPEDVVVVVPRRRSSLAQDAPLLQHNSAQPNKSQAKGVQKPVLHPNQNDQQSRAMQAPIKRQRRNTVSNDAHTAEMVQATNNQAQIQKQFQNMTIQTEESEQDITTDASKSMPRQNGAKFSPDVDKQTRPSSFVATTAHQHVAQIRQQPEVSTAASTAPQGNNQPVRVQGRKRTNTVTGFLKLFKASEEEDDQKQAAAVVIGQNSGGNKSKETSNDGVENGEGPRSLRFTFNSNTTSSKDPDEIVREIFVACHQLQIKAITLNRFMVECIAQPANNLPGSEAVRVEVEVCKLPRLKNMHGLKFKRLSGSSSDYKTVCELLLKEIKL